MITHVYFKFRSELNFKITSDNDIIATCYHRCLSIDH